MRGITCNKISSRHAFLLNLLFGKNKGLKYLEEFQNITAICEIIEGEEEINPDINIVDYECIGNSTLDEDYTLSKIEEANASGEKIINSLEEINNKTQILFNESKTSSNFSLNDSIRIIKFTADSIEKISSNIFVISGKTNKIISKTRKLSEEISFLRKLSSNSECYNDVKVEFNVSLEKENCSFCFGDNYKANLTCALDFNGSEKSELNLFIKNGLLKVNDESIYLTYDNNTIKNYIITLNVLSPENPDTSNGQNESGVSDSGNSSVGGDESGVSDSGNSSIGLSDSGNSGIGGDKSGNSGTGGDESGGNNSGNSGTGGDESKEQPPTNIKKNGGNSNKSTIIIICIIVGIVLLGGIIVGIVFLVKKCKADKIKMMNNNNISDQKVNDNYKSDINLNKNE